MKAIVGKTYRHYKNKHSYTVLAVARHTEAGEDLVVYQGHYETDDLAKDPVFARPKECGRKRSNMKNERNPDSRK